MPLNDQFRKYMTDSAFADIRNGSIGGRAGSSNTVTAFPSSSFQIEDLPRKEKRSLGSS